MAMHNNEQEIKEKIDEHFKLVSLGFLDISPTNETKINANNTDVICKYAPNDIVITGATDVAHIVCEGNVIIVATGRVSEIYARGTIYIHGTNINHIYSCKDVRINITPGTIIAKTANGQDTWRMISNKDVIIPAENPAFTPKHLYCIGNLMVDFRTVNGESNLLLSRSARLCVIKPPAVLS